MPIEINGSGTITGISAGGLPDSVITTDDIAASAVTPAKLSQKLTLETAKASTSGTSVEFTGIPSWVKRITIMLDSVSTNSTNTFLLQLGSGSYVTSGYVSRIGSTTSANAAAYGSTTNGFYIGSQQVNTDTTSGVLTIINMTGNTWAYSGITFRNSATSVVFFATAVPLALSGTLDSLRIISSSTGSPADTFDAGSINIMYEG